ncbi:MAG: hypothetical protein IRZ14_20855, partial [Chloroflexi bacterium]|nr:hypothetical protein [Chloroflexota bacterium]
MRNRQRLAVIVGAVWAIVAAGLLPLAPSYPAPEVRAQRASLAPPIVVTALQRDVSPPLRTLAPGYPARAAAPAGGVREALATRRAPPPPVA